MTLSVHHSTLCCQHAHIEGLEVTTVCTRRMWLSPVVLLVSGPVQGHCHVQVVEQDLLNHDQCTVTEPAAGHRLAIVQAPTL